MSPSTVKTIFNFKKDGVEDASTDQGKKRALLFMCNVLLVIVRLNVCQSFSFCKPNEGRCVEIMQLVEV